MANVKISDLPAAASAGGTDQLETNQGGTSRRLTVAQVATHVRSTATDTVVVAAGSASAPSIAPTGDSNTGIFFPAADTIAFSEGGVEALRLDSSGNATFAGTVAMASSFLRNRIINGDMRIDQRNGGASVTINAASNTYTMDRWLAAGQATDGVFTIQRSTVAPAGFSSSALITVTTADASIGATQAYYFRQPIEGFNTADLSFGSASAQSVTLSFWVRSSVTGTFGGAINNSAFNRSYPFSFTISAANTWEYKTVTISGDTTGTWLTDNGIGLAVTFSLGMGSTYKGTAGSWSGSLLLAPTGSVDLIATNGATFYLTGVQLEVFAATPFERRQHGQELLLCQRYFQIVDTKLAGVAQTGIGNEYFGKLSTTMRATPTVSIIATTNVGTTGATVSAVGNEHYGHYSLGATNGGYISAATGRFNAEL